MKKLTSMLLALLMVCMFSVSAFAQENTDSAAVQKYIAEQTESVQKDVEAKLISEDGKIVYLNPEVKIERVGNLQNIKGRNIAPEDGVYKVTVRADSSKENVDENQDFEASLTLVVYYEQLLTTVKMTQQHYSYAGNRNLCSVTSRYIDANGSEGLTQATPLYDSGTMNWVRTGTLTKKASSAVRWQLKDKQTSDKSVLFVEIKI